MKAPFDQEAQTALAAIIAASRLCTALRSSLIGASALLKEDRSPVTIADYGAQAIVCRMIREAFPHDPIVAEEDSQELTRPENSDTLGEVVRWVNEFCPGTSPQDICSWIDWGCEEPAQRFWTLDPIDGTKGFLRGDQYAIALALIEAGEVRLGVLGCPNLPKVASRPAGERGVILIARRDQGAFETDLEAKTRVPIGTSGITTASEVRLTESFEPSHSDHASHRRIARRLNIEKPPLRMDSQAKYAVLARGEASVYLRLPSPESPDYRERIWDHAAGSIIVQEARGTLTDAFGRDLDFSTGRRLERNQGVVATHGVRHETVLQAVQAELDVTKGSHLKY